MMTPRFPTSGVEHLQRQLYQFIKYFQSSLLLKYSSVIYKESPPCWMSFMTQLQRDSSPLGMKLGKYHSFKPLHYGATLFISLIKIVIIHIVTSVLYTV